MLILQAVSVLLIANNAALYTNIADTVSQNIAATADNHVLMSRKNSSQFFKLAAKRRKVAL